MSDDLGPWPEKVYLLHPSIKSFGDMVTNSERREYVLADHIKELERERDEAQINHAAWKLEAEAIQANLAKMVEALRKIANAYDINWHAGVLSRAALAELEGGSEPNQKQSV